MSTFEYVLPVIRGIQAGREYYVSMCPLRLIPKLFPLQKDEIPPIMRSHRTRNKSRVNQMTRYIINNPKSYIFSSLTASIDADPIFEPIGNEAEMRKLGRLRVPMDAKFTINDGAHRREALELALKENPALGYETIPVIFFLDIGLKRAQQIFHDLNRYAVRPPVGLNLLYNHSSDEAKIVREVIQRVAEFRLLTETERSTISVRSRKLFTLTSLYEATIALLTQHSSMELGEKVALAVQFWESVSGCFPDWKQVSQSQLNAREIRRDYIHCHPVALLALGEVGAILLSRYPDAWEGRLQKLTEIDWSRSNPDWHGKIIVRGEVCQSPNCVEALVGYLLEKLV